MQNRMNLLLIVCLMLPSLIFAQSELKPMFDKALLDIGTIEQPEFKFEEIPLYINKLKLKTDFDLFEPYIRQGMKVSDFQKINVNTILSPRQIFTIRHPSGRTYTVINRMPGLPFSKTYHPNAGYGVSASFDFNQMIYYALHPGARARKKQTVLKREQITHYVYQID